METGKNALTVQDALIARRLVDAAERPNQRFVDTMNLHRTSRRSLDVTHMEIIDQNTQEVHHHAVKLEVTPRVSKFEGGGWSISPSVKIWISDEDTDAISKLRGFLSVVRDKIPDQPGRYLVTQIADESEGVDVNTESSRVTNIRGKIVLEDLIRREGEVFWDYLEELGPGIVETVALRKQHNIRQNAVEEFEEHIQDDDWNEPKWQEFFQNHQWIFGHNLMFQFVTTFANQGYVGGTTMSGRGAQRTDMLVHTEATAKFTVLVYIKRPSADLVGNLYRNKVHSLGHDLTGGVSQLQSYCRTWITEGARQEENAENLSESNISTFEPRGILVVGNLSELDDHHKRATFELYRRNLRNPEIITYDELLERARFTVRLEQEA